MHSQAGIQIDGRTRVRRMLLWKIVSTLNTIEENFMLALSLPWNFANDISNGPAGLHVVELVTKELHVFFHARHKGIVYVNLIKIPDETLVQIVSCPVRANLLDEVSQTCECENDSIKLEHELAFFR